MFKVNNLLSELKNFEFQDPHLVAYVASTPTPNQIGWGLLLGDPTNKQGLAGTLKPQPDPSTSGEIEAIIRAIRFASMNRKKLLEIRYTNPTITSWLKDPEMEDQEDPILKKWKEYASKEKEITLAFTELDPNIHHPKKEFAKALSEHAQHTDTPKERTKNPPKRHYRSHSHTLR